jgi:hypothetical protein
MAVSKSDIWKIILLALIPAILATVVGLLIYNYTMTPHNNSEEIDKINSYLNRLITGFN